MNPNNQPQEPTPETNNEPKVVSDITSPTPVVDATPVVSEAEPEPIVHVSDEPETAQEPVVAPVITSDTVKKPSAKKYIVIIVVILLFAAAAVGGVYYWQNKQLSDAKAQNAQLQSQLATAKSTTAADTKASNNSTTSSAAAVTTSNLLLPGQVDLNAAGTSGVSADSIYLGGFAITDTLASAWIEYGTAPDKLTTKTATDSTEFGMGDAGTYKNLSFPVKKASLQAKVDYYYHVAAKDKTGNTIYSGVAAFTNGSSN